MILPIAVIFSTAWIFVFIGAYAVDGNHISRLSVRLISVGLIWLALSRLDKLLFALPLVAHNPQQQHWDFGFRFHCARWWAVLISMQILHFIQVKFYTHTFTHHCALPISHFHCRLSATCLLHTLQSCLDFSYFSWSATCNLQPATDITKYL